MLPAYRTVQHFLPVAVAMTTIVCRKGGHVTDEEELVRYAVSDGIARITLNRPHRLNALTGAMGHQFRAALERLDDDEDAIVGIIEGAGRAFCSGADVEERQLRPRLKPQKLGGEPGGRGFRSGDYLLRFANWKPVIAAVHGYAVGGGLHIALSCDLIVAAEGTQFQVTEVPRGLNGTGIWSALVRRCGETFANDVSITGRFWAADEAYEHQMLNKVVPAAELEAAALAMATSITANPPLAVQEIVRKRRFEVELMDLAGRSSGPRHLRLTEDFLHAATAFVEKQPTPAFHGR
jgi:enoyl-CoA hydratase/carnithine racemase